MSVTEETEEQVVDRLLREMGIRLPEVEPTGDDSSPPPLATDTEAVPLSTEISERRLPPFSS